MPCAYCGGPGSLTREHIWPRWLHEIEDHQLKYNFAADKVLPEQQVIKDVCSVCNNGPLSLLDDYARQLYVGYFSKPYKAAKITRFRYDYGKLSRWLLKTAYNSARAASASDVDVLRLLSQYIICDGCCPINVFISIGLLGQLIREDRRTGKRKITELRWHRSGPIYLTPLQSSAYSARVVIMNSWIFNIVVPRDPAMKPISYEDVKTALPGRLLSTDNRSIRAPTIKSDADGMLYHYQEKFHLYDEASKKLRR